MYESTIEGKRRFVEERLAPMMKDMDSAIESVTYSKHIDGEFVFVVNKNPDKTMKVNVSADSIKALVADVMLSYSEQLEY